MRIVVACLLAASFFSIFPVAAGHPGGAPSEHGSAIASDTQAGWTQIPRPIEPPNRMYFGMAYDSDHRKIVVFGGSSAAGPPLQDTWLFDVATGVWTDALPPTAPSPRSELGMVYDASIDRVVLFGGYDGAPNGETWHYDTGNNTWTKITTTGSPGPRHCTRDMAYDSVLRRVVMYGGYSGGYLSDTWAYDGVNMTWSNKAPSSNPGARCNGGMAYDAWSRRIVLFAGANGGPSALRDTWTYDLQNDTWTQKAPSTRPLQRAAFGMAYDPGARRTMLFGGSTTQGVANAETWAYDVANDTWSQRWPTSAPAARYRHSVVFDAHNRNVVTFGGNGDNNLPVYNDIWGYDLVAERWADRSPSPPGRMFHAMQYDANHSRTVMFGGGDDQTWAFNGSSFRWENLAPTSAPIAMYDMATTYQSRYGRVLVHGGHEGSPASSSDKLWSYDFAANSWVDRTTASTRPSARFDHSLAYDSRHDRVILFGGWTGTENGETWAYDYQNNTWDGRASGPTPRYAHSMAYDATWDRVILFGGLPSGGFNGETWSYDYSNDTWLPLAPSSPPSARVEHQMTYDSEFGRVLLFGGFDGIDRDDLWAFWYGNSTWQELTPSVSPPARSGHAMSYDSVNRQVLVYGGQPIADDTWIYRENPPPPPTVVSTVPADWSTNLSVAAPIRVEFDQAMIPWLTEGSFSISPPLPGGIATLSDRNLTWNHSTPFASNTTYTVTISSMATSASGVNMSTAYSFTFSTGATIPEIKTTLTAVLIVGIPALLLVFYRRKRSRSTI